MFNDSRIAMAFTLGKTKCGCYINYSIAPFYNKLLIKSVKSPLYFVCSFDESLNRIFQDEQMDIQIRLWDNEEGVVKTNYLNSQFIKRPNAENLHNELHTSLNKTTFNGQTQYKLESS